MYRTSRRGLEQLPARRRFSRRGAHQPTARWVTSSTRRAATPTACADSSRTISCASCSAAARASRPSSNALAANAPGAEATAEDGSSTPHAPAISSPSKGAHHCAHLRYRTHRDFFGRYRRTAARAGVDQSRSCVAPSPRRAASAAASARSSTCSRRSRTIKSQSTRMRPTSTSTRRSASPG